MTMRAAPAGAIWRINLLLFGTAAQALIAWAIWPSSLEWWGFGLLAIVLGLSAFATLINTGRTIAKIYEREKIIARIEANSRPAEQTEFADFEALKKAGMINE